MRRLLLLSALCTLPTLAQSDHDFLRREAVYRNRHFQLTGISAGSDGRLFINFPRWSDRYLDAVIVQTPDAEVQPYPDVEWNRWDGKPQTASNHFVCVQSVVV